MTDPDRALNALDADTLRVLVAGLPLAVVVLRLRVPDDPLSFVVEYANPAAARGLGVAPEQIVGRDLSALTGTANSERPAIYVEVLRSGKEQALDDFFTHEDGAQPAWLSVRAFPMSESLLGLAFENVTARRMNEERLVQSERFLNSVLENLPEMVFVKDAEELRFVRFNKAGELLLGHPREALLGRNDYDFFPVDEADFFIAKDRQVLANGAVLNIPEEPIHTAGQGMRFLHTKKIPIADADGTPRYLLGISHDITDQKRASEALLRKTEELARSNAELEQFAYVASHDLQEPLRKVLTFGDRLKVTLGASLTPQTSDYLDRMLGAASRMRALIEDLLTLSRITTTAQPFAPVDLREVARDVISDLDEARKRVQGSIDVAKLPTVDADAVQMRQLLQNLIANALKFHAPDHSPHVSVSARVLDAPGGSRCELVVRDDGIGFDEKFVDRVFAPFQRLHARSEYEGTGMGLAICKRIAERHGGAITVESHPGEGAKFTVTLPLHHAGDG